MKNKNVILFFFLLFFLLSTFSFFYFDEERHKLLDAVKATDEALMNVEQIVLPISKENYQD
jgi:hypothetical protein